jgi:hypothetical protein
MAFLYIGKSNGAGSGDWGFSALISHKLILLFKMELIRILKHEH